MGACLQVFYDVDQVWLKGKVVNLDPREKKLVVQYESGHYDAFAIDVDDPNMRLLG